MSILTIILMRFFSVFKNLADYTVEDSTALSTGVLWWKG